MYEKKINILNEFDRNLSKDSFKYNVIFAILVIIMFILLLVKKKYYYQNIIEFKDNKNANLIVSKEDINIIKNHNELIFNNLSIKYNIENIEEKEEYYLISINLENGVTIKSNIYKILVNDETLLKYIIRIIGG